MGYFAARSAPFGVVPTEVVTAAFYNFAPERVAKALPAAWEIASPSDAVRVRQDSAVAALRRYGVTDDDAGTAAELAWWSQYASWASEDHPTPALHVVASGDHSFKLSRKDPAAQAAVYANVQQVIVSWVRSLTAEG